MHKKPIFNENSAIHEGYVVVDNEYHFYITEETEREEADVFTLSCDLYRINVKLKENTNA